MLRRLLFCISLDLHYLCPYIKQGNTRYDGYKDHAIYPGTSTTAGHDTCATPESQYDAPYGNALKSAYSIQPTPLMNLTRKLFLFFALAGTLCLPSSAQERAKPRNGEGVSTFLYRFGYTSRAAEKEFRQINKGKFTKDGGLILGRSYRLPTSPKGTAKGKGQRQSSSGSVTEPLFGPSLQKVKVRSHELDGACLYLVSGHGGPDPGAIGKVGKRELHEDEYAYDIILRLARSLMQKGAKVHIIIQDAKDGIRDDRYLSNSERETCMGQPIPLDQVARLQQRCDAINRLARKDKEKYKRSIFIHVDSRGKKDQVDVFFYHSPGSKFGKRLTENIHSTFERKYDKHQPNRGFRGTVSERRLYVLLNSTPVAAFLELGNIQNERDRKRLVLPSNRQALADWICEGIVRDYKER